MKAKDAEKETMILSATPVEILEQVKIKLPVKVVEPVKDIYVDVAKMELDRLARLYDRAYFARHYGINYGDSILWRLLPEMLIKSWGYSSKRILDFGCGLGWLVKNMRERGIEAFGVEASDFAIMSSPVSFALSKPILQIDQVAFIYGEAAFDWVMSFEALEHIPEKDVDFYIAAFRRSCKKGFIGSIYLRDGGDETHVTVHDRAWWIGKFMKHGFVNRPTREHELMSYPTVNDFGFEIFWFEVI
jgi:2-polyprenyl-3-methyl-5-hydroxy-6-metoxy-1,4-benzoquinol methylase